MVCPQCGYNNRPEEPLCSLCDRVLRQEAPAEPAPVPRPKFEYNLETAPIEKKVLGLKEPTYYLLLGTVLGTALTLTPMLQYMGWFLASLTHEMGHCLTAWFFGCPSFPAIRIDGHAAACYQPQIFALAVCVMLGLAATAWYFRNNRKCLIALILATLLYPLLAFTAAKEVLHLLAGHLGELAFAVICIWRTLHGGFTRNPFERAAYSMLGWYLVGRNVMLCQGLLFSAAARAEYAASGSFGLTNDYLRLANDLLQVPVQSVALIMGVTAVAAVPLGILISRFSAR